MKSGELDRRLRMFEKKHPVKKEKKRRSSLSSFVGDIERQLDKHDKKHRR